MEEQRELKEFLKREEIRTMQKDIVRLRELDSQGERERIAAIKLEKGAKKKIEERLEEKMVEKEEPIIETVKVEQPIKRAEQPIAEKKEPVGIERPLKLGPPVKIEDIIKQPEKEIEETEKVKPAEIHTPQPIETTEIIPPSRPLQQPTEKLEITPGKKELEIPKPSEIREPIESPAEIYQEVLIPRTTVSSGGFQGFLFKIMVVAFLGFIFVAVYWFSGFFYWYFFIRPIENPTQIISPAGENNAATTTNETQITVPASLVRTNATEFLEASSTEEIPNSLSQIMKKSFGTGSTTRILIKNTEESKIIGLKEFFEAFKINSPVGILDKLDNDFTLFVYTTNKNQLGFVTNIKEKGNFVDLLNSWEPTMEKDTTDLFAILGKKGSGYSTKFKSNTYKNTAFRCLSFATSNFGICWSTLNDYFIWTTSGESMLKIIDDLNT